MRSTPPCLERSSLCKAAERVVALYPTIAGTVLLIRNANQHVERTPWDEVADAVHALSCVLRDSAKEGAMTELLHFADICSIAIDAGLADVGDATEWLARRGLCGPAVDQYAGHMIDAALDSDHDPRERLEAMFVTGLTLGIAIGEASRDA